MNNKKPEDKKISTEEKKNKKIKLEVKIKLELFSINFDLKLF